MKTARYGLVSAAACFALSLTSCSYGPVKGYDGPKRSPAELSVLRVPDFAFESPGRGPVLRVDDEDIDPRGVAVLPGSHTIRLSFLKKEPAGACVTKKVPDWSRYWNCVDKQDLDQGVCGMYLNTGETRSCPMVISDYRCSGSLETAAGREYVLVVSPTALGVIETGTMRGNVAIGACSVHATTTEIDPERMPPAPQR